MNNQINFSATWIYGTGNTMTMPIAQYLLIDGNQINEFFEYGSKNDFRMPAYHRLDISCNVIKQKNGKTSSWTIGIYRLISSEDLLLFRKIRCLGSFFFSCRRVRSRPY